VTLARRVAAGFVVAALVLGSALVVVRSRGGPAAIPIAAPARVALVYAKPIGTGYDVKGEVVYAASPSGRQPTPLAEGTDPLLSPNGRWVAYIGGPLAHPSTLRLVSTLGGHPRDTSLTGSAAVWSTDGQLLAVAVAHHGLALLDARTLRTRVLNLHPGGYGFSFSPDGSALVYETNGRHGPDIYTVTIKGDVIHRLTSGGRSIDPLWGPRGIAFERYLPNGDGDVWLMGAEGSDPHQLTHTHAGIYPAAWSADGTRMLAAYPATHNGRLYAVDVATGRARPLTRFVGDLFPQGLSRDGHTVLASIGCGGLASPYGLLETIPFAGGRPTVIVRGPCAASSNF
jgi:Tol biopolymer transport system component